MGGVQATLISTIPVGQVIRRLMAALKELEGYKRALESLVEERTGELVKARDEARAANRAKSVFLANMSHELRTPLNAILGFSNLLRERGASEQQRHDLGVINRSGEHLLALINDVLDVAKIEAGRTELVLAACDLGRLIEDVTEMIRARAIQKGLTLRVEAPESLPFIRTDAARLRQVLLNLLNNAVKFTEQRFGDPSRERDARERPGRSAPDIRGRGHRRRYCRPAIRARCSMHSCRPARAGATKAPGWA